MGITDARKIVGKTCSVQWLDRTGHSIHTVSKIHDVTYVPLYGGYLIADTEDIRLDKIVTISVYSEDGATVPIFCAESLPAAA